MNRPVGAVLAAAAFVLCSGPAFADAPQRPDPAPPTAQPEAPEVHARKLALVHRYFEAVRLDSIIDKSMASMIPVMVAEQAKDNPKLTAAQQKLIADTVVETMPDLTKKVMERTADMYASALTEEELSRMVDFYSSAIGRSIIEKSAKLTSSIGPLMAELMPEFKADFTARLCHKIDCRSLNHKS